MQKPTIISGRLRKEENKLREYEECFTLNTAQGGGKIPLVKIPCVIQKSELRLQGKLTERNIVPTLKSETKKGDTEPLIMIPDARIRRLTPTEAERLQGFPDGWTSGISDSQRYKCLGNAVSVPVVKAVVMKLKEYL
jgi:site-specific DNA-cytosine methylase